MVFYNSNYNCNNSIEDMTVSMSLTSDSYKKINKRVSNSSLNNNNNNNNNNSNNNSNNNNNGMYANCCESKLAVVDLVILIAVIGAFGYLLFPYVKYTYVKGIEIGSLVYYVVEDEICENPVIYASLGVSIVCVAMAAWAIVMCTTRKCRNPTCRGLWKAAEFDIQLETEECVKSLNSAGLAKDGGGGGGGGVNKGLFELPRDHHRELEAELKKIAPPNGRAVLVFRARCGCSVGRMEVPGPKRLSRKIKK